MEKRELRQKNFRQAVINSGIELTEIAKRSGICEKRLQNFMKLDLLPNMNTFANICEILDVSADDILGLKN